MRKRNFINNLRLRRRENERERERKRKKKRKIRESLVNLSRTLVLLEQERRKMSKLAAIAGILNRSG